MRLDGKKVLMVCTTDNMIWQFLTPHIDHMTALGASVDCACNETGFWFDELAGRGYIMHKIGFKRSPFARANIKVCGELNKLIKAKGYDVVYCHQPVGGMAGRIEGKKNKCKVIYVAHNFFFWKGCPARNKLLYRTAERWLSKKTDALVTINTEDYEAAKKMKAKKVYYVHGVGLPPRKSSNTDIRQELDIGKNAKVVLTVSEFIPRKNYPLMLRAMAKVEDAVYLVCGSGREEDNIKKLAESLGMSGRVIFAGYRRDIIDIMKASDLLLHFSKHEGLPVAVMEAMSCGLPVVASDIRGTRDLITSGGALLPPLSTPETIAHAVKVLLGDEARRREMGAYNISAAEKYRIENVLPEYDKIYEDL